MKLRTKFALVLLLITLVLSGSVYGGLELYKDRLVEGAQDDVNETATRTADQLDASIEDRKDFIGFVSSRPEAARFSESDRFLNEFVDNSRFFAAQLVDENGTIVDFHGDVTQDVQQESIGSNVRERPYVQNALDGQVHVSEPEYVESTGKHLVVFSAPIFEDRRVKGVLAGAIYLDDQTIFGVLSPISQDDQRVTVTADSATLYRSGEDFEHTIEATRTVESTGWTVTVVRDRSGLLARLRELAIAQGIGLLLVMLSVVVFGIWEYRTTLAQTENLLAGFEALEEGEYDHQLSLAAAEEWEQIGRGFNALADSLSERESLLRQREQRLQVLNRVLRHNVRNNAAIVLGYAEVIRGRSDDEGIEEAVDSLEVAGADLEALSEKARQLEFTMEERDGVVVMDASRLVADVVDRAREEFPAVSVRATLPAEAWVEADPSIRKAVENVCENACKHNDAPHPELVVTVERNESVVTIAVDDNGGGMPEQEWEVIDAGEETPLEHGSGLGLWVAQWAVRRSGGELTVAIDDGIGTTVTIELPAATAPDGEVTTRENPSSDGE